MNTSINTPPELAVVVPTYNERENVGVLVSQLDRALPDIRWEVIFVDDDSIDKTADQVRRIGQKIRECAVYSALGGAVFHQP